MEDKPRAKIERGSSVTGAERRLAQLCDRSFLSMWSYPSVYRDQGKGAKGHGKEVCDLLVVFGEDIIIFSDKDCDFPTCSDPWISWSRWHKRAIASSVKQLLGARRWITSHPTRLFLDRECKTPLPAAPDAENARIHLVLIAHGSVAACKSTNGGNGSLKINTKVSIEKLPDKGDVAEAFSIGSFAESGAFIHVLDDFSVLRVLSLLDTASDFIDYLKKKESLFRNKNSVCVAGEENLLAYYMVNMTDEQSHGFPNLEGDNITIDGSHWRFLNQQLEFQLKIQADKVSYLWDELIQKFIKHEFAGTQYFKTDHKLSDIERALRAMARENRFSRRMYSEGLREQFQVVGTYQRSIRVIPSILYPGTFFVSLMFPPPWAIEMTEQETRRVRRQFLECACHVLRRQRGSEVHTVVGLATESDHERGSSEDLMYGEFEQWTTSDEEFSIECQGKLKILTNVQELHRSAQEFPRVSASPGFPQQGIALRRKIGRNEPCPCRSGLKYKKCCMP